jgi:hypothetical protein
MLFPALAGVFSLRDFTMKFITPDQWFFGIAPSTERERDERLLLVSALLALLSVVVGRLAPQRRYGVLDNDEFAPRYSLC